MGQAKKKNGKIDPSSRLCIGCNLCCNGSLFGCVVLEEPDSEDDLREQGFPMYDDKGDTWFPQPCPGCSDQGCQIYTIRPATCRSFRCRTLKDLEADRIDLDTAQEIVREGVSQARALDRMLRRFGSFHRRLSLSDRAKALMERWEGDTSPARDDQRRELRRAVNRMKRYSRQHFYKRGDEYED